MMPKKNDQNKNDGTEKMTEERGSEKETDDTVGAWMDTPEFLQWRQQFCCGVVSRLAHNLTHMQQDMQQDAAAGDRRHYPLLYNIYFPV
jgi:alkylhydroperoxidase family enzyme